MTDSIRAMALIQIVNIVIALLFFSSPILTNIIDNYRRQIITQEIFINHNDLYSVCKLFAIFVSEPIKSKNYKKKNLEYTYLDPKLRFMFLDKYNDLIEQGLKHEDIIQFHRNSYKKPCKP